MKNITHEPGTQSAGSIAASREYLAFRLGQEEYGVDILKVQEIRTYEAPTRMPEAPRHVAGVLNLRGVIVPILDLRHKFNLPDAPFDTHTVTIVLALARGVVGVVVDAVSDVVNLAPEAVKPAPEIDGVRQDHLLGIGVIEDGVARRMLILVEIERLLQAEVLTLARAIDRVAA